MAETRTPTASSPGIKSSGEETEEKEVEVEEELKTIHAFRNPFISSRAFLQLEKGDAADIKKIEKMLVSPISFGAGPFSGRYDPNNKDPDMIDNHQQIARETIRKALEMGNFLF